MEKRLFCWMVLILCVSIQTHASSSMSVNKQISATLTNKKKILDTTVGEALEKTVSLGGNVLGFGGGSFLTIAAGISAFMVAEKFIYSPVLNLCGVKKDTQEKNEEKKKQNEKNYNNKLMMIRSLGATALLTTANIILGKQQAKGSLGAGALNGAFFTTALCGALTRAIMINYTTGIQSWSKITPLNALGGFALSYAHSNKNRRLLLAAGELSVHGPMMTGAAIRELFRWIKG